ncbi:hypothetical protein QDR66_03150 [Acinetobacter baumannii]|uniref:hypothetical protein n=1 Tax=Acinetobacter baumannii TaxID=470 RepID=UPI002448AB30|nr:hypothetical protein [Acinetobacter baumannii]MDH2539527.1 hypothetical protein [Acinetobacter baumannii]
MDNYKIINTHTNEIIKALNELGYVWTPKKFDEQDCLLKAHWILAKETGEIAYSSGTHIDSPLVFTELTLPQLRDLVVLKRNDVKDANRQAERGGEYFITSDGDIYFWIGKWVPSTLGSSEPLTEIETNQPQSPALISGAEAKLAWANGKDVQISHKDLDGIDWTDLHGSLMLSVFEADHMYIFRLKPQTIKLELELPKPFEPEEDCHVYILDDGKTDGYRRYSYEVHGDKGDTFIGIWRTEDEIKQVVEQLRKIRGAS